MLALDDLTFAHPGQTTTYRFTMEAAAAAVTAVRGASGSGKSTLLDLIAGFLPPTSGTITLDRRDLLPLPPEQRPVSILFQSETLFEHLTAAHNVALGLPASAPATERDAKVEAALREVGLPGIGHQRADTLSGGQKQRVALARTLLRNQPILLLDEPFSALDDESRADARGLVKRLTEAHGWTTILVTHHADDIAAIAARSYRIVGGMLEPETKRAA